MWLFETEEARSARRKERDHAHLTRITAEIQKRTGETKLMALSAETSKIAAHPALASELKKRKNKRALRAFLDLAKARARETAQRAS